MSGGSEDVINGFLSYEEALRFRRLVLKNQVQKTTFNLE